MPASNVSDENRELTRKSSESADPSKEGVNTELCPSGMLTRPMLAARLGVSEGEIRRRERAGQVVPVARNTRGWNLYDETTVAKAKKLVPRVPSLGGATATSVMYTPEEAVLVFEALNAGKDAITTVLDTKVHPLIVEAIAKDWARLTGALVITKDVLDEMNKLTSLEGVFPIRDALGLLDVMKLAALDMSCMSCGTRSREVCQMCAKRQVRQAARGAARGAVDVEARPGRDPSAPSDPSESEQPLPRKGH